MIKAPRFFLSPLLLAALLVPTLSACRQPVTHESDSLNESFFDVPRVLPKRTPSFSPLLANGQEFFFLDAGSLWWSWSGTAAPTKRDAREWRSLATSNGAVFAVLTNGTLWASGPNERGQLGLGHALSAAELTQLGTAGNWLKVAPTPRGVLGLRQDGSLWVWGDGDMPKLVQSSGRWNDIFAVDRSYFAISPSGALFAWGNNDAGQLGLGPQAPEVVDQPRLVGNVAQFARWKSLVGTASQIFALRSDGSLWSWGGLGSVPVRLGTENDWKQIAAGHSHVLALKKDGSLWAWGAGEGGQLGLGEGVLAATTPQRVGEGYWLEVAASAEVSAASGVDGFFVWGELGASPTWRPSKVTPRPSP